MISYKTNHVKQFMNLLLRLGAFDGWEVREIKLHTMVRYTISGEINPAFFQEGEEHPPYILWQDMKDTMFDLIKGRKQPSLMQITLAFPKEQIMDVPTDNIESFLLNIHYENGALKLVAGTSVKTFSLDRSAEQFWDGYVAGFLEQQGIEVEAE